jgi:anhydro-N-acetylmuramic acid kinase
MSGTSLDGLDIAACIFHKEGNTWHYEIEEAECVTYSEEWSRQLQEAPGLNGYALTKLDTSYGFFIGEKVNDFLKRLRAKPDLVSSHGHTIFHNPSERISLQIGKASAISAVTGLPVVSDFRSMDVSSGGQGAPLVPAADKILFGEYAYCLNLGGIANISYDENETRIAYDICPCNLVLNRLANEAGKEYDEDGSLARQGNLNSELLQQLNSWQYYLLAPPKSLDKETLLKDLMPLIQGFTIPVSDKLRTVTEHIALMIAGSLKTEGKKMLATGGGAFNSFLMERLSFLSGINVIVPDKKLVSFKEALAFAFLGLLRVMNEPNCLKSVTGAKHDSVGGSLYGDFSGLRL